ncbi:MAG TPA: carbohydrate-binding family 9-like protein [Thermoanaerobaculia bacterium]|nr:carbohydrate-binding family 9-like protein [Thermoanaerobaculia bacterium]
MRSTDGGPLRQRTAVRVAWHEDSLLVRFECADVDAWGTYSERDAPLWSEEAVEVFLAPGGDTPRRYVEIEVSPRGVLFDALIDNPDGLRTTMRADVSWKCPGIRWRVGPLAGRSGEADDWWAEIALPLRSVLPGTRPLPALWRANFHRIERPRLGGLPEEYAAWSPTLRDPPDFHVPERFGLLRRPLSA